MKPADKKYVLTEKGILVPIRSERELEEIAKDHKPDMNYRIRGSTCIYVVGDNGNIHPKLPGYKLRPGETRFLSRGTYVVYMRTK